MAADIIVRSLARLALFKGLTLLQLNEIARRGEEVLYHPDTLILEDGAEGDAAYLIISGEAVRVSGPEFDLPPEPIPQGSLLGETAMLVEATYGSTIMARDHVRALRIRRGALHAQMLADPTVADQLVHNIAQRLQRLADDLRQVDAAFAEVQDAWLGAPDIPQAELSGSAPAP
jgi:CRP-like cAMP-binding protein